MANGFSARQLEGRCEVSGQPWEVEPYRAVIHRLRWHVVRENDTEIVALCSRPQWADLCASVRTFV